MKDGHRVADDAGQWGGGQFADADPPLLGTLIEVFPAVAVGMIGVELVAQMMRIVVGNKYEDSPTDNAS